VALAYVRALLGDRPLPPGLEDVPEQERRVIAAMVSRRFNTPLTSSMGRLFDAVSALLGICFRATYEAQAAIELEMLAHDGRLDVLPYAFTTKATDGVQRWGQAQAWVTRVLQLQLAPLFAHILDDLSDGVPHADIAARFHLTVARMIVDTCERLRSQTGLEQVVLSGGCFQNRLLLSLVLPRLQRRGFRALTHRQVPCNDGGIALGQAVIAHYAMNGD
jgi:hydrogenase maturation protein HypF